MCTFKRIVISFPPFQTPTLQWKRMGPLEARHCEVASFVLGQVFKLQIIFSPITGVDNLIVNLSKTFTLTSDQCSLLLKGLTFIPTPSGFKTKKIELLNDLQTYHHRLQLKTYFQGKKLQKKRLPFMGPSEWTPSLLSLLNNIR